MEILFDSLEDGQFLITIDSFVYKLYDGYNGIDDTEILKDILECNREIYKAANEDEAYNAEYHKYQQVEWLKSNRENIKIAPTVEEYFWQKESLKQQPISENLPF